jgi:hypothetical protein
MTCAYAFRIQLEVLGSSGFWISGRSKTNSQNAVPGWSARKP